MAGPRTPARVIGSIDDIVASLEAESGAPEGTIRVETLALLDAPVAAGLVAELGPLPTQA